MLTKENYNLIRDWARNNPLEEVCGLIIANAGEYNCVQCRNIASDRKNRFVIDAIEYLKYSNQYEIVGMFHSQLSREPSIVDNFVAFNQNLYSIIYSLENDNFAIIRPELEAYLNKDFKRGEADCLTLLANYYKKFGIIMTNFPRNEDWFKDNPTIVHDNIEKESFVLVDRDKARKHDALLFGKTLKRINHLGVYLGDNLILHHPYKSKSIIEYIDILSDKRVVGVARYKGLLDEK